MSQIWVKFEEVKDYRLNNFRESATHSKWLVSEKQSNVRLIVVLLIDYIITY